MKLPIFAAGNYVNIQTAIDSGDIFYPAYIYVRDKRQLAFVDKDNSINLIVGENKSLTKYNTMEDLPIVGDEETLYVVQGIVYTYNGESYVPTYKDNTSEIEDLTSKIGILETTVSELKNTTVSFIELE